MEGLAVYDSTSNSDTTSNGASTDDDLPSGDHDGLKRSPPDINRPPSKKPRDVSKVSLPSPLALLDGHDDIASLSEPRPISPQDNPALHGDRVRRFPHVVGNYATTVFIPVTIPAVSVQTLDWIVQKLEDELPGVHPMKTSKLATGPVVGKKLPILNATQNSGSEQEENLLLHMSLSRVVTIRYPDIEMFIGTLKRSLQDVNVSKRFDVELGSLKCFINDDCTRSFAAFTVKGGGCEVCQLVEGVNKAFAPYALQQFYDEPNPHISIAWMLGDKAEAMKPILDSINLSSRFLASPRIVMKVEHVHCRVGQYTYTVW